MLGKENERDGNEIKKTRFKTSREPKGRGNFPREIKGKKVQCLPVNCEKRTIKDEISWINV